MDIRILLQAKELLHTIVVSFPPERKTLYIVLFLFVVPLVLYSFSCSIITKCAITRLLKEHPEIIEKEFPEYPQVLTILYCFFWLTFPAFWIRTLILKAIRFLKRRKK